MGATGDGNRVNDNQSEMVSHTLGEERGKWNERTVKVDSKSFSTCIDSPPPG